MSKAGPKRSWGREREMELLRRHQNSLHFFSKFEFAPRKKHIIDRFWIIATYLLNSIEDANRQILIFKKSLSKYVIPFHSSTFCMILEPMQMIKLLV